MTSAGHDVPADSPVIVLLAAGEGRRYGGPKQLAMIDGEPMMRRVARIITATGVPVIVVTGAKASAVEATLEGMDVHIERCTDWSGGMGHSVAAGARAVQQQFPAASALLLCLADQPLIETAMLTRLLDRHREAPEKILTTGHEQTLGPPTLFPRDCIEALTELSGAAGAKSLLQREPARVERCLDSAGIDVDTVDALLQVQTLLATRDKTPR